MHGFENAGGERGRVIELTSESGLALGPGLERKSPAADGSFTKLIGASTSWPICA